MTGSGAGAGVDAATVAVDGLGVGFVGVPEVYTSLPSSVWETAILGEDKASLGGSTWRAAVVCLSAFVHPYCPGSDIYSLSLSNKQN